MRTARLRTRGRTPSPPPPPARFRPSRAGPGRYPPIPREPDEQRWPAHGTGPARRPPENPLATRPAESRGTPLPRPLPPLVHKTSPECSEPYPLRTLRRRFVRRQAIHPIPAQPCRVPPPKRRATPRDPHPAADLPRPRAPRRRTPRSRFPLRPEPDRTAGRRAARTARPDGDVTGPVVHHRRTMDRQPVHSPHSTWPESCAAIGSGQDSKERFAVGGGAEPEPDREPRGDFQPVDRMLNLQALVRFP